MKTTNIGNAYVNHQPCPLIEGNLEVTICDQTMDYESLVALAAWSLKQAEKMRKKGLEGG